LPLNEAAERREFLVACSATLLASIASSPILAAQGAKPVVKRYQNAILSDEHGRALRASTIKPQTNYIFHYPFVATPCLLLDLGRDVGGVGKKRSIVAFSAICSHKLAYPAKEVSFIRFQANASTHSEAERIHCCADHSVYDPAAGAAVVKGPAPTALAAIALEYDAKRDELRAIGTAGEEQFEAFFAKYDFKLSMEYGNRARSQVGANTRLQELTQYCRNVAQC
jgi:arsenite oxidase small subunit